MEWIRDHSALNRLFFMSSSIPSYQPDTDKLFYLRSCNYVICCSLILNTGEFATVDSKIIGTSPMIIFCHGTGSNVGSCYNFGRRLAIATNCHVLSFDYPGYGLSSCNHHANESSACLSVEAVLDHVITKMLVPISNLVLCGHSLGTALATYGMQYCCNRYCQSIGGLILMNPFLSMRTIAQDMTVFGCLILERLNTQTIIQPCPSPILIIHGHQDEVVPVHHGIALYNSITGIKEGWFPEDGTHDHCDIQLLHSTIKCFIDRHLQICRQDYYINDTPRARPCTNNIKSSVLTEITATTGEVITGFINDSYRTCFFL